MESDPRRAPSAGARPALSTRTRSAGVLRDAARMLRPPRGDRHGPLAPLLLVLTAVTGVVDAVSYLKLGHVFVANMTGNVVFVGFALAGAHGLSTSASLFALGAFLLGALAGGRFGARHPAHRATCCGPRPRRRRRSSRWRWGSPSSLPALPIAGCATR
jgi:Protein of unknown function (DUF1275)